MKYEAERGVTLIDTIVGTALMLVIFLGIAAAFKLSVDVVSTNKAQAGAVALSDERMEFIRSLTYAQVGTVGGIPSGTIPQSETVTLNGVTYTRRTLVEYADDPVDGTGAADANHITEDYKAAKVDVSWVSRSGTRHIILVTRISPPLGMESNPCSSACGTLTINSVDSLNAALANAQVTLVNAGASPAVNLITYTNASGVATLVGAPAASGYSVVVTKTGYSTAQTYSATAQNTNPNPGNLTVSSNQTTSSTFAIDVLGQKTINTWTQVASSTWTDLFADASKVATSSSVTITSSTAHLSTGALSGEVQSVAIAPAYLATWKTLSWVGATPAGTSVVYRVYDANGVSLIPNSQIPGNSAGLTVSAVDLSHVSTSTYTGIRLDAVLLGTASSSPSIDSWTVAYTYGPVPLANIPLSMKGAKSIGSGPGGTVYKYSQSLNSGSTGSLVVPNLEWDAYTISVASATGYDVASACNPQPESLSAGGTVVTNLYLAAHTTNSILLDVRSMASGLLIPGASVRVFKTGYDTTVASDACGQSFFSGLASGTYSVSVSATGYTTYTNNAVSIGGTGRLSVSL